MCCVSPELVLVDPELARIARVLLRRPDDCLDRPTRSAVPLAARFERKPPGCFPSRFRVRRSWKAAVRPDNPGRSEDAATSTYSTTGAASLDRRCAELRTPRPLRGEAQFAGEMEAAGLEPA